MSSFFLKGKPKNNLKRKSDKHDKKKGKIKKVTPTANVEAEHSEESSNSELDLKKFSDFEDSDSEHETVEEKKLRLAKKYLEEIAKEEQRRADQKEVDEDHISQRLRNDYLDQQGKLQIQLADTYDTTSFEALPVRCKEHKLSITCLCLSSDGNYLYSGSKCSTVIRWSLLEKRKLKVMTYKTHKKYHEGSIASIAVTTDLKFLAVASKNKSIQIWNPVTFDHLHTFTGHRKAVTDLSFRKDSHELYSASHDRSVKVWSLDEMAYVETLFGHQTSITSIDTLSKERALTSGGRDNTLRIWKIVEESQLVFNGPPNACLDVAKFLNDEHFLSGGDDGSLCIWSIMKKKPLCVIPEAHGSENEVPRWITSLSCLTNTDVVSSGSYDGYIRLWKISDSYRKMLPLFSIEVKGFINSLLFAPGGHSIIAGVGQEHKNGRWWKNSEARNSLVHIKFNLTKV